jgi:outer membrane protein assembly factor BamB
MGTGGLEYYSSLIRSIDGECSLLCIEEDSIVAGSRSGELACWNITTGLESWRVMFGGPCSNAEISFGKLYISEAGNLHCIDFSDGSVLWSAALEGSSDLVRCTNNGVWVTSSVYNLEIQDYYDSSVWLFDGKGGLSGSWPIEGRAWSLELCQSGALIGLSRPKCGYAHVSISNGVEYFSLEASSPVTIGVKSNEGDFLLGHSNGWISLISGEVASSHQTGGSSITSLDVNDGWVAGTDSGLVSKKGGLNSWEVEFGGIVDMVRFGPSPNGGFCVWISAWSGASKLALLDLESGLIELEVSHRTRIRASCSAPGVIALGDFEGNVFLLEEEVVSRRNKQTEENIERGEKRLLLRSKIRGLRKD